MIVGLIVTGLVGVMLVIMGYLIWKKEKISLLHEYHYDNVPEEDKKAFCTLSGIGIFSMGISLLITTALLAATDSPHSFLVFAAGFAAGLVLLIHAGKKYNSGDRS